MSHRKEAHKICEFIFEVIGFYRDDCCIIINDNNVKTSGRTNVKYAERGSHLLSQKGSLST